MRRITPLGSIIFSLIFTIVLLALAYWQGIIDFKGKQNDDKINIDAAIRGTDIYIITSDKYLTMQNDGGSHYNTFYVMDQKTREVEKKQDKYVGFQGYEYKNKVLYSKVLTTEEFEQIKSLLKEYCKTEKEENVYDNYIVQVSEYEVYIYDKEGIQKIEDILKEN